jgi:hypothetical protein
MSYSIFAVILLGFGLVVAAWCYLATYTGNCAGPKFNREHAIERGLACVGARILCSVAVGFAIADALYAF